MKFQKAIPHPITITPSHNDGFIVKVGCGTFVAETKESLLENLKKFLDDPDKVAAEYGKAYGTVHETAFDAPANPPILQQAHNA